MMNRNMNIKFDKIVRNEGHLPPSFFVESKLWFEASYLPYRRHEYLFCVWRWRIESAELKCVVAWMCQNQFRKTCQVWPVTYCNKVTNGCKSLYCVFISFSTPHVSGSHKPIIRGISSCFLCTTIWFMQCLCCSSAWNHHDKPVPRHTGKGHPCTGIEALYRPYGP